MHAQTVHYKYDGDTPGADANDYVLFVTPSSSYFDRKGLKRFLLRVNNSHSGTLKAEYSTDGRTTWTQYEPDIAVSAPATDDINEYDFLVEGFRDWRLVWTNGGSAQTTWDVMLSATDHRDAAT